MSSSSEPRPVTEGAIVYPRVNSGKDRDNGQFNSGRWGTHTIGAPSEPQAHPENQQAATWEPIPGHVLDPQLEGSGGSSTAPRPITPSNPYVSTAPVPSLTGKAPMDVVSDYLARCSRKFDGVTKKAEEAAGNLWQHFKTGPNIADTAWGRLSQGTKPLTEGGFENVFKQTFDTLPDEKLRKTYACYLSTSSGPVAGTLYISTEKIAFCSDRPLSYQSSPGQTHWSFYKLVVPLNKLGAVDGSSNPDNVVERYIQVVTIDHHEFWFMGFVNYDKAFKNLSEAQALKV